MSERGIEVVMFRRKRRHEAGQRESVWVAARLLVIASVCGLVLLASCGETEETGAERRQAVESVLNKFFRLYAARDAQRACSLFADKALRVFEAAQGQRCKEAFRDLRKGYYFRYGGNAGNAVALDTAKTAHVPVDFPRVEVAFAESTGGGKPKISNPAELYEALLRGKKGFLKAASNNALPTERERERLQVRDRAYPDVCAQADKLPAGSKLRCFGTVAGTTVRVGYSDAFVLNGAVVVCPDKGCPSQGLTVNVYGTITGHQRFSTVVNGSPLPPGELYPVIKAAYIE